MSRAGPTPVRNRLRSILWHVPRYQVQTTSRLASDAGVAKSAISRLLRGVGQPNYILMVKVAEAIGREIGRPFPLREIAVAEGSEYPTPFPCSLFGCRCLPPWAYDGDGALRPQFTNLVPGEWSSDAHELTDL